MPHAPDANRVHFGENRGNRRPRLQHAESEELCLVSFSPLEEEGKEERRLPGDIILAKVICCQVDCRHHSHRRRELPYRRVVSVIPEILWGNPRHLSYSLRDTSATSQLEGRS